MASWESCPLRGEHRKAYQLRDRASDREKFFITATYELQVTGNLEKARRPASCGRELILVRSIRTHSWARWCTRRFGKYEKGVEAARKRSSSIRISRSDTCSCPSTVSFSSGWTKPRMRFVEPPRASSRCRSWQSSDTTSLSRRATRREWNEKRPGSRKARTEDLILAARVSSSHIRVTCSRRGRCHAARRTRPCRPANREGRRCGNRRRAVGSLFRKPAQQYVLLLA